MRSLRLGKVQTSVNKWQAGTQDYGLSYSAFLSHHALWGFMFIRDDQNILISGTYLGRVPKCSCSAKRFFSDIVLIRLLMPEVQVSQVLVCVPCTESPVLYCRCCRTTSRQCLTSVPLLSCLLSSVWIWWLLACSS